MFDVRRKNGRQSISHERAEDATQARAFAKMVFSREARHERNILKSFEGERCSLLCGAQQSITATSTLKNAINRQKPTLAHCMEERALSDGALERKDDKEKEEIFNLEKTRRIKQCAERFNRRGLVSSENAPASRTLQCR